MIQKALYVGEIGATLAPRGAKSGHGISGTILGTIPQKKMQIFVYYVSLNVAQIQFFFLNETQIQIIELRLKKNLNLA